MLQAREFTDLLPSLVCACGAHRCCLSNTRELQPSARNIKNQPSTLFQLAAQAVGSSKELTADASVTNCCASVAGPAAAALDTESSPAPAAGTAAKVEGSNLLDQSGSDALSALQDVAIPNVRAH